MLLRSLNLILIYFLITFSAIAQTDSSTLQNISMEGYYNPYISKKTATNLRLPTSSLNTPQNIQILSQTVLKDQLSYNINENITRNVSGAFREELHNMISPDMYFRGSYVTAQRNGVDVRPLKKGPIADDIAVIDQVEFIKGPSSFMNSVSDPGGSYNVITKSPEGITQNSFALSYGSFNYMRAEADLQGVFDKRNKWQYRLDLMGMQSKSFMKYVNNDRLIIAPSLKYQINDNSSLTLQYIYQKLNYSLLSEAIISPYGYNSLPRDFSLNDPSVKPYHAEDHSVFLTFEQKLRGNWVWTTRLANIHNYYNGRIMWVYGVNDQDPDILDRHLVYDYMQYNIASAQSWIYGQVTQGIFTHSLTAGIDFNRKDNLSIDTWETAETTYPLSIKNPQYNNVISISSALPDYKSENQINQAINRSFTSLWYVAAHALYNLGLFKDKLTIGIGGRLTYATGYDKTYEQAATSSSDLRFTPRVSINYLIIPSLSIYALWDNSFLPRIGKDVKGKALKPLLGRNIELGVKKEFMQGKWVFNASVYDIFRNRFIINTPTHNAFYQVGTNRTRGVEVDLRGRIVKGLSAIINYAYTDAKILSSENPHEIGMPTPNLTKHIHNLWLTYQLPIPHFQGLQISFGYQYLAGRTERYPTYEKAPQSLADIFKLDAGLGFVRKKWNLRAVVNNLLNSNYAGTGWYKDGLYYWVQAAPINFRISLGVKL